MQETFLAALNSKTVPPEDNPGRRAAWLRGVARNSLLLHHRKRRRAAAEPTDPHVVQAHGGTVDVSSTPGAGTSFTLRFPLA